MLPWAKGWLASQALGARLIGPSWGINKRRYYRNFGTSRLDFLVEDALLHLPHYTFSEDDYRATGEVDFSRAIECWANAQGLVRRRSFVVSVGGMWGGYPSIRSARPFLLSKLLNSRDALSNAHDVLSRLDRGKLFVAVHVRSAINEFSRVQPGESPQGRFNILIPGEWYLSVCEALRQKFGDRIQFHFFTDRGGPDFDEAVRRFNPGQTRQRGLAECSDLVLMSQADLRVCSISSYSLMASFLSGGPYLWYKPQLTLRDGFYTLWGNEVAQQASDSLTSQNVEYVTRTIQAHGDGEPCAFDTLGTAMDIGDPLPNSLVKLLDQRLSSSDSRTNLLEYGCLPEQLQVTSKGRE